VDVVRNDFKHALHVRIDGLAASYSIFVSINGLWNGQQ
jgi:hypothetical protein